MSKKTKEQKEAQKAFEDLISLYDIVQELRNNNLEMEAEILQKGLDKASEFISKQK